MPTKCQLRKDECMLLLLAALQPQIAMLSGCRCMFMVYKIIGRRDAMALQENWSCKVMGLTPSVNDFSREISIKGYVPLKKHLFTLEFSHQSVNQMR